MTKVLNRRLYDTGDTIFREGDEGSQAFVLQSGSVRIVRKLPDGEQGTLGYVEPGGIFGEMALIDQSPRMATAIAHRPAACIVIPENLLQKKLKETDPKLRMLLLMMIRLIRLITDNTKIPADTIDELSEVATWTALEEPEEDAESKKAEDSA